MISHSMALHILRSSLGIVFVWFGILKLFNVSPVLEIIQKALPSFLGESQLFLFALAFTEILIGAAFLANKLVKLTALVMMGHLAVATLSVLITQGFNPRFPLLSLEGEFVLKNVVLIAAGLLLLSEKTQKKEAKAHTSS